MKVLSLFDGMACGMIAMKNAGVKIDRYVAYEIDKYAIKTATYNFPEIEEMGDVFNADFTQYQGFDFLIGGSPCFTKGHLVLTKDGYKDISEIKIGDIVLTHKNRFMPVTRLYKHSANTVNLKIQGYPEFTTTENHPFYTINRSKNNYSEYKKLHSWRKFSEYPVWTKVSDMTTDTFCGQHIHNPSGENEYNLTEEECYILGRYVADGHIRHDKRKGRQNSYQYQLILSVGSRKLNDFTNNISQSHYSCYPHTQSVYRCVFSSKRLVEIAEKFGRGAANKEIPEFVFDLPVNLIGRFIDGYMSGDGAYNSMWNQYTASTISAKLAFGLQRLIGSHLSTNVGVSIHSNNKSSTINGRKIVGRYPLYNIFFKKEIQKQSVAHVQNDIIWTNIQHIEEVGRVETVYNIEVAEDHSYTVNNCIVHNCTYWSIAQSKTRETIASGLGWELFSQYVRALYEAKPKYFIYENNKSMSKAIRDSIRETFGFEEICINSALVSAQNRQRYYWVGKRNEDGTYSKVDIEQPTDKGVLLKDVLDIRGSNELSNREMEYMIRQVSGGRNHFDFDYMQDATKEKGKCITANISKGVPYNVCCEPIRCGTYPGSKCPECDSKQYRIYDINGKAVTQCGQGGGLGAKTGLYAVPCYCQVSTNNVPYAVVCERDNKGIPIKAASGTDGKTYTVYDVYDGQIVINGMNYPIKLDDGYYIVRKLTVNECQKLQTVPDWYEFPVSNTQAYKMLGNGWTCDVITHLIKACL